jgi:hypothetical protein
VGMPGCGYNTIYPGAQKTWVPIEVKCGVGQYIFIAYAINATGNTGRGIYIDDAGIGDWTPTFTPTISPTGTLPPTFTSTPTFNEFMGTPTFTHTPTYTFTITPTPTATSTPTPSSTPSASSTPTPSPSFTPTPSATPTPTTSPTPTITPTPCLVNGTPCVPTPTVSPTPVLTPNSSLLTSLVAYPNSAKQDQVTFYYQLSVPADQVSFKLYTVAFRKVDSFTGTTQAGENQVVYNVSGLANGLYYYVIDVDLGGKHERKIGKLIIAR